MTTLQVTARQSGRKSVEARQLERLQNGFSGYLLYPEDRGFDEARSIWNAMIDRRPALIARCKSPADVQRAIHFARDSEALLSIRGGGHNIAGSAVCDGGVMIDLSLMKAVQVDERARTARVSPGATLSDLDQATLQVGLATPVGINSTTGVAGLTLGGGFGWLSRKYGMTIDNLIGVDVVTADGQLVRADEAQHPDLFWALRGGGGNFGVVTSFDFRLHPVPAEILAGLLVYPAEQGQQLLRRYADYVPTLGDDTAIWAVLRKAPPLPFLPASVHGRDVVVLAVCHVGDPEAGRAAIEPLRSFSELYGEHLGLQPLVAWQRAFDPLLTPGARNYWKSHYLARIDDRLIEILLEAAAHAPSPHSEVFVGQLGGATARVPVDATAFAHRAAEYVVNVHGRWLTSSEDDAMIEWARKLYKDAAPFATGGVYVNFLTADESERVHAAYGENYDRLAAIKRAYDPTNLFRINQNIRPA